MTQPDADLSALIERSMEVASRATPGPWEADSVYGEDSYVVTADRKPLPSYTYDNVAHIAQANPVAWKAAMELAATWHASRSATIEDHTAAGCEVDDYGCVSSWSKDCRFRATAFSAMDAAFSRLTDALRRTQG